MVPLTATLDPWLCMLANFLLRCSLKAPARQQLQYFPLKTARLYSGIPARSYSAQVDKTGRITKGVGGIYTVFADGIYYKCTPRGVFRNTGETPLVGDLVRIAVTSEEKKEASLHTILPRKNCLTRPPAANIGQVIITVCEKNPLFNQGLLDRFLLLAADADLDILICVNKSSKEQELFEPYKLAGYDLVFTDALSGFGLPQLKRHMAGNLNLFAGASGVGKSSLINAINPGLNLETGVLSKKTSRGKHTTRHTEIFPLGQGEEDGFCFDTPGFTSLDFSHIKKDNLSQLFREFLPYNHVCKFTNCKHIKEIGCAVKAQVGKTIHSLRYESYVKIFESL